MVLLLALAARRASVSPIIHVNLDAKVVECNFLMVRGPAGPRSAVSQVWLIGVSKMHDSLWDVLNVARVVNLVGDFSGVDLVYCGLGVFAVLAGPWIWRRIQYRRARYR